MVAYCRLTAIPWSGIGDLADQRWAGVILEAVEGG